MIRFIDLEDQITEGCPEFAFYDTVTSSFLDFDGFQAFENNADFCKVVMDKESSFLRVASDLNENHVLRCLSKIPDKYCVKYSTQYLNDPKEIK